MRKIQIKNEFYGVQYNNNCPYCGLNTNLLPESERVEIDAKKYCVRCYREGVNKRHVTPEDSDSTNWRDPEKSIPDEVNYNLACERKRDHLPRLEIAHLHGSRFGEGAMYLDMYPDIENDVIYFRLSIIDDDDAWFGSETYDYLPPDYAVKLLNKNDIHILNGLTEENWKEFFEFL